MSRALIGSSVSGKAAVTRHEREWRTAFCFAFFSFLFFTFYLVLSSLSFCRLRTRSHRSGWLGGSLEPREDVERGDNWR